MSTDFDKGMRPNLYELMVGGGGGEIPPATRETLGGVIIGTGVNVDEDGTISVTAPAPEDTYTKAETDALLAERDGRINNLDRNLAEYEDEIDAQQDAQDAAIGTNAANIATLQNDVDALEAGTYTKSEIDAQQATQNTAISANASSILTLIGDVSTLNAGQDAQDAAIEANANDITTLQNDVDALEAGTYTKAEIDAQQSAQDTAINANASSILTLQNDVDALEAGTYTKAEIDVQQSAQDTAIDDNTAAIADLAAQIASDLVLGLVKTDSSKNISVDQDGVLQIGGRLGQLPDGGVFYPTTIEPTEVKASAFLMSDGAKNLSLGARTFGIMAGVSLTCRSAAAGTTQYRLSNNQSNRFACFACRGGRLAIDQADAQANGTALITDISFTNGNPISAYFGPTENSNDIIITVDRTVNPNAATTKLRMYGTSTSTDAILVGQGNGASGGKAISLGQACHAGGNQCIAFGNSSLSLANNSVALGHTHLVDKQFCFCAGQGHDFTNGSNGAGAVGIASEISSDTAFAVGNGIFNSNGNITRSNAFEVLKDGSIVLKSPNNTKFKISVDDNGQLITTQV